MTRRHIAFAAAGAAGAIAAGALVWWFVIRDTGSSGAERAGSALGRGVLGAVEAAGDIGAPHRCARVEPGQGQPPLELDLATDELTIGFVADARGASPDTLDNLGRIRAAFDAAMVDVVISLGGMGATTAEIQSALGALASDAAWPIVAVPGDRESLDAHRAAIAALGPRVHDGSRVRAVTTAVAVIGTLPGATDASHLPAGVAGCMHTRTDIAESLAALPDRPGPRILASYVAPRQSGESGSDLAAGGVHAGSLDLAAALADHPMAAVVHAMIDPDARPIDEGSAPLGGDAPAVFLATGSADSVPLYDAQISGAALIVRIGGGRISWRRLLYWLDD